MELRKIALVLLFTSCTSVKYIKTELPQYEIDNIERPQVAEEDINNSVIKLIEYARIKEIQLDNFYKFYEELRNAN